MSRTCLLTTTAIVSLIAAGTAPALAADTISSAIAEGKPIINIVARYEHVNQDGFENDASAPLIRARLGYQSGSFKGFSALFDFDLIRTTKDATFNSTINGKTAYPVVADPSGEELNQLKLSYMGPAKTKVDLGRQRIILDNARFIGNVGWRLNEQTYDALFITNQTIPDLTIQYGYFEKIHRIFGKDSPVGTWASDSHILHAAYTGLKGTTVSAYAYILDLTPATLSTATYGIRAAGKLSTNGLTFSYAGEYAHQTDHAANPNDVSLDYYLISGGAGAKGLTGSLSYEVLGGDGTVGFSTPLATLHAFQGWADVFLTTPASGITDLYGQLSYNFAAFKAIKGVSASVIYHDFNADTGSADLGSEWDAVLNFKISSKLSALLKYADYKGPTEGPASRQKTWVALTYNY